MTVYSNNTAQLYTHTTRNTYIYIVHERTQVVDKSYDFFFFFINYASTVRKCKTRQKVTFAPDHRENR